MTTDELINSINTLTHHVKMASGVDGNTGHLIDGKKGYYAFIDEDSGDVICHYSNNGYAHYNIFRLYIDEKEFEFLRMMIRNDGYYSAPKDETAKLFKILSLYLDQDYWLPTKEFKLKEIESIKQEITSREKELQELKNKLDIFEE